ncbi:MAG TPA: GDP-L-fucose synthase [Planctomycetota bacterium]|nr:GDP-L-fucose synthase [Planctomycetota bacterium]
MAGFWSGKKVVVTGGAGFVGSVVCDKLKARGAETVIVPRRKDYDLTDVSAVRQLYDSAAPDIVLHLAAEVGGIGANMANPGRYFYANMAMGLNLIEEGRKRGLKKFVQVGTICAYPKFTPVPFKEEDLWNGYPEETNAPYGVAKKALLVMLQSYRQQYGFNGIYLLPVNLYGPRDNFDLNTSHVIPALIRKCLAAQRNGENRIVCWGSGKVSREFLYVDDCAEGLLLAAESYDGPEPVNLGTGREISIKDLAELIARLTGFKGSIEWDAAKPDGQPRRCLSVERAERLLGFKARMPLEQGLQATIEWARGNLKF